MPRRIRLPILLSALALTPVLAVAGASAAQDAHVATACKSAAGGSLNGGYYLNLSVKGTGCATGRKVENAWQSCRLKSGTFGRCHSKAAGFSCSEVRQSIPSLITAKVSCHSGSKRVSYTYQQNK